MRGRQRANRPRILLLVTPALDADARRLRISGNGKPICDLASAAYFFTSPHFGAPFVGSDCDKLLHDGSPIPPSACRRHSAGAAGPT
jgi:hypothetical protein